MTVLLPSLFFPLLHVMPRQSRTPYKPCKILRMVPRFVVNINPHHVELNAMLSQLNDSLSVQTAGLCHWQDGNIVGLIV